jgi:2-polyprenyl-3-methyl-5-hydroxy-6-metoxy-1,4-benzoquinol methylase
MLSRLLRNIVLAYDSPIVRAYCIGRFGILRQRFLDEIGQYLPDSGSVLDVGCGFGLFSLYYASVGQQRRLLGIDRNPKRIEMARRAAARLGLTNVTYDRRDARDLPGATYAAIYMLDIIHHLPAGDVESLLLRLRACLQPGGRLLVKDVDTSPTFKRWFTWILDRLMDPATPVSYWPAPALQQQLEHVGFQVHRHLMVDFLPYPHVLYICTRP